MERGPRREARRGTGGGETAGGVSRLTGHTERDGPTEGEMDGGRSRRQGTRGALGGSVRDDGTLIEREKGSGQESETGRRVEEFRKSRGLKITLIPVIEAGIADTGGPRAPGGGGGNLDLSESRRGEGIWVKGLGEQLSESPSVGPSP